MSYQQTSAISNAKLEKSRLQKLLIDFLDSRRNLTDKELSYLFFHREGITIPASTVSGLRNPLVRRGDVAIGERRRCGVTGNKAIAWKLVKPIARETLSLFTRKTTKSGHATIESAE